MNGHIKGYVNGVLEGDFIGVIDGEMGAVVRPKDTVTMEERDDARKKTIPDWKPRSCRSTKQQDRKNRVEKIQWKLPEKTEISDNSEDRNTKKQQKAREQKMNSKRLLCFLLGAALSCRHRPPPMQQKL